MKRWALILALAALPGMEIHAQELSNTAKRRMNALVLQALEEYETNAPVADRASKARFLELFRSRGTPVFCDLYNSRSFLSDMPASAYCDTMMDRCENVKVELKNIRKGGIIPYGGVWHYILIADKSISFHDGNTVLFPFQDTLSQDFRIEIVYYINENMDRCLIEQIRCLNAEEYGPVPEACIVRLHADKKDAERDREVTIGSRKPVFNRYDQGYSPKGEIEFWDSDVTVRKEVLAATDQYEYIELKYTPKYFRLKLRGGAALRGAYRISAAAGVTEHSSCGYEGGIDFGRAFPVSKHFRISVFTGAGISYSEVEAAASQTDNSYWTTDSYGAQFLDLLMPLYLHAEVPLDRRASLFAEAGVKFYFNTFAKVNPPRPDGTVSGSLSDGPLKRSPVDVSLAGYAGADICLYRNRLFLEAKAGCEEGLNWSRRSGGDALFDDASPPAGRLSLRRHAIWLHLGLMMKF